MAEDKETKAPVEAEQGEKKECNEDGKRSCRRK